MALLGDKLLSDDDEISDGVDSVDEMVDSSEDSLNKRLTSQKD